MDTLDILSQEKLDKLLKLDLTALSPTDCQFLAARRSYLTAAQREFYADIFDTEEVEVKQPDLRRSRGYRALQAEAKALGLKYVGVGRDELERSIDTAKGPSK